MSMNCLCPPGSGAAASPQPTLCMATRIARWLNADCRVQTAYPKHLENHQRAACLCPWFPQREDVSFAII